MHRPRKNWPKLSKLHFDRLTLLALACSIASSSSSRERAPFIDDTAEATMWKLVRMKYVEVELAGDHARFRPTARGWMIYDRWVDHHKEDR